MAIFEVFVYQRAGINSPARGTLTDTGGAIEFWGIQSLLTREANLGPGWRLARAIQTLQPNPVVLFRTSLALGKVLVHWEVALELSGKSP